MPRNSTGPAAYHARLEAEKLAKLEARIAELDAMLTGWISPFQQSAKIKEAVTRAYTEARRDGYRAGWADKASGVAPHQYPYPEQREAAQMMTAADR